MEHNRTHVLSCRITQFSWDNHGNNLLSLWMIWEMFLVLLRRLSRCPSCLNKDVNLIDIRSKYFGNFRWFEVSRVNLSHGSQNWFELTGVSRNRGWNYRAWVKQIQGKQGLVRNIESFVKPRVREIGIPLYYLSYSSVLFVLISGRESGVTAAEL